MEEIWREVKDYTGRYEVSNFGRVRSWVNNVGHRRAEPKVLKPAKNNTGYLMVSLCKDGKRTKKTVHRLVAEAFIENPSNLPQVNHLDEDKTNNASWNLEWCTCKHNQNFGTRTQRAAKAHSKSVLQLDLSGNPVMEWPSLAEAHRQTCWSIASISMACHGKRKTFHGFIWKYVD